MTERPVYEGVVYVAGTYRVWAVDVATGAILWSSQQGSGSTSPIVTADSVYLTSSCSLAIRLRRADGSEVWRSEIDCTGGGGEVGVLYRDRLYTRAFPEFEVGMNWTLNAKTGKRIAQNPGGADPAFADGRSFFRRDDGVLEAFDVKTNTSLWTFAGFGRGVATSPHVVDGFVYAAAADGELWVLHPATGAVVWSTELGAAPFTHMGCCGGSFVDMAAWDGILVVVTAQRVVALEPVSAEASFDTLVVDDSGANRLEMNSATGAYRITECGGTTVVTGVGVVTRPAASTIKLAALTDVAKVTATIDTSRRTAKAKVKLFAPAGKIKIVDSNTADDVRECR
ncbi:MAG: PQQ-binding-like beta-propeller repeat protein [Blastocatellia bacterium]|nr:PQQ-binding-like beta-propeller repeat protein [Blastocatellia bacterium]